MAVWELLWDVLVLVAVWELLAVGELSMAMVLGAWVVSVTVCVTVMALPDASSGVLVHPVRLTANSIKKIQTGFMER